MRCSGCGSVIIGNTRSCPYCGAPCETTSATPTRKSSAEVERKDYSVEVERKDYSVEVERKNHGTDVYDSCVKGVLEIVNLDEGSTWSGSGFIISEDGYALTNAHVASYDTGEPCKNLYVRLLDSEYIKASVVRLCDDAGGHGTGADLALIKLSKMPKGAKILRLENFDNVRNGERVFVIGNSLGHGTCITNGIVSDKCRIINGKMKLMTDCAVNGGNSGGPMFNENGLVIAVVVSGITGAEGMNFAIPSSTVKEFLDSCHIRL